MKISKRCKKQIEDIERIANKFKMTNKFEPYQVVMWNRDFESISELYLAYKSLDEENETLKADFEESEDRCATLEAENNKFRNTIKNMNENFREHLNALEAENHDLKDKLFTKDEEIRKLYKKVGELRTIKKSFEVLRALYLGDYEDDEPF